MRSLAGRLPGATLEAVALALDGNGLSTVGRHLSREPPLGPAVLQEGGAVTPNGPAWTTRRFFPLLFNSIRNGFSDVLGADAEGRLFVLNASSAMLLLLLYAGSRRTCVRVQRADGGMGAWPDAARPSLPDEFSERWAGDGGEGVREQFPWGNAGNHSGRFGGHGA